MLNCNKGIWSSCDSIAHKNANLKARIAELEAQLVAMTSERDSESRWAKEYHDRAKELEAQLAAAQERERWTPCSEEPKTESNYLVSVRGKVIVASWFYKKWYCPVYEVPTEPTHWRELPPPPEASNE
jgi:DNA repair exonuclease SbcCD ATPase subunit